MVVVYPSIGDMRNCYALSKALKRHGEFVIKILEGPISSIVAKSIRELILSPNHTRMWVVTLIQCTPQNDAAHVILAKTFQEMCVQLQLVGFNSNRRKDYQMLSAVFRRADPNQWSHTPINLTIDNCVFDAAVMPHLQSWSHGVTVRAIFISGSCFRSNKMSSAECLAEIFEGASNTPKKLEFEHAGAIGDMKHLEAWELDSLSILGSKGVKGLSSMNRLTSLDLTTSRSYGMEASPLSMRDCGVLDLLGAAHCQLKELNISGDESASNLFHALMVNHNLRHLDISGISLDQCSIGAMVKCLGRSCQLERLSIDGTDLSNENIHELKRVLSTTNHCLERLCIGSGSSSEVCPDDLLKPYTMRNRGGRRMLIKSNVPVGLWVHIIFRIQQMDINSFYGVELDISRPLRADATYHFLREGSFLFS